MIEMPSQLTSASASKAPSGDKCAPEVIKVEEGSGKVAPIATTVIKINNFTQWASSGCVVPYLSVYFLHYTQASPNDVGIFMLISSFAGIFINFLFSSLADRYRAHRAIYISMLAIAYVTYSIMLIPILITPISTSGGSRQFIANNDQHDTRQESVKTNITLIEINTINTTTSSTSQFDANDESKPQAFKLTIDQQNVAWFYVIGICVAIGNLSSSLNMNFSDSFSANAARSAKFSGGPSFGSLRFFSAIGWVTASFSLTMANQFQPNLPYLLPSWLLFFLAASANMLLVLVWPDKRPFDMANSENTASASKQALTRPLDCTFSANIGRRWLLAPCWSQSKPIELVRLEDQGTLAENGVGGVCIVKGRLHEFDSQSFNGELEDEFENGSRQHLNVRRCSIAPMGNSYICEQFVISRPPKGESSERSEHDDIQIEAHQHFKYIAKIEPVNKMSLDELRAAEKEMEQSHKTAQAEQLDKISFKLYLKILELIARRNRNMLRFMLLYIVFGFVISLNWIYLMPYLEHLDGQKFKTLSACVMMSSYLSETLFYFVSVRLTSLLNAANGLTFSLLMFAARYAFYLAFADGWWPLELIVVVEMMQSVSIGWFECIYNESALEFALEAEKCVPTLVELGLMPNTPAAIEKVRNSVKLTLFSVSSCCFDGLGMGLGSLLGGWIINKHGFFRLWSSCVSLALTVCLANVFVELVALPAGSRASSASDQDEQTKKGGEKT